jgi:hypothetical protein
VANTCLRAGQGEEVRHRLEVRGQRHDGADVQVLGGPAVEPAADAGGERVVDGGVTQGALDAHRGEPPSAVEGALHPHHRVGLEQGERHGGIVEVHRARGDGLLHPVRERLPIHLETGPERGARRQPRPDTAVVGPGDGLLEVQRAGPERLVPEGVEAEDVAPVTAQPQILLGAAQRLDIGRRGRAATRSGRRVARSHAGGGEKQADGG